MLIVEIIQLRWDNNQRSYVRVVNKSSTKNKKYQCQQFSNESNPRQLL